VAGLAGGGQQSAALRHEGWQIIGPEPTESAESSDSGQLVSPVDPSELRPSAELSSPAQAPSSRPHASARASPDTPELPFVEATSRMSLPRFGSAKAALLRRRAPLLVGPFVDE
jgi:hypothetical protein